MVKNGKYYIAPQNDGGNFKQLFARLTAEGAGRPVDSDGVPDGSWTPDLLTDAICAIDANRAGIDLRTVQVWFQDNDNGISTDNVRWLARIFGCNDPEATSHWQAELTAAKEQLAAERRKKRWILKGRCDGFRYLSFISSSLNASVGVLHPRHFLGVLLRRSQIDFISRFVRVATGASRGR